MAKKVCAGCGRMYNYCEFLESNGNLMRLGLAAEPFSQCGRNAGRNRFCERHRDLVCGCGAKAVKECGSGMGPILTCRLPLCAKCDFHTMHIMSSK